jgi:hypothetical protein
MMDWKAMAKAGDLGIPDQELDRIAASLDAIEEAFRPLVKDLKPEDEPAPAFSAEEPA